MTPPAPRARRALPLRALALASGDVLALVLFVLTGRDAHGAAGGWAATGGIAGTAAPFVAAWLVAAAALEALRSSSTATPRAMATRVLLAWIAAFPLAALGRALLLGRASPWTFYIVAFCIPLLLLAAWRLVFALIERGARRHPAVPVEVRD